MPLRSDLLTARPGDPYLRFRFQGGTAGPAVIDGDHVAVVRVGRRTEETWITALGDDPARILSLIDTLSEGRHVDGIHVDDEVYFNLPERLRIPDPGWWSIWTLQGTMPPPATAGTTVVELSPSDGRIDALLAHSDSAYLFAGDDSIVRWVGIEQGDRLVAVAGQSTTSAGSATLGGVPHLVSICVDPDYRGRGFGGEVTAHLARAAREEGADEVYLEMYAGNLPAARAYARVGFVERARYRSGFLPDRPAGRLSRTDGEQDRPAGRLGRPDGDQEGAPRDPRRA